MLSNITLIIKFNENIMDSLKKPLTGSEFLAVANTAGLRAADLSRATGIAPPTLSVWRKNKVDMSCTNYSKLVDAYNERLEEKKERFGGGDE